MNNKYDFKQIGKRIREERTNTQNATGRKKAMTQSDLANEIGVSRQTIAKWEHGEIDQLLMGDLLKLCNLFNCELGYILGEYNCRTRTATDIHKEICLSEVAISRLSSVSAVPGMRLYTQETKDRQTALNAILEFNESVILELIHEYLYRDEEAVDLKDGRILSPETIIEAYMLDINAELKFLRKQIKGGSDNGQR